jgi:MFS family permease
MREASPLIPPPSSPNPSEAAKRLLPWLVAVAFFMESLDTTILNTAVPAISSALGVAPLSMKAVLASYTLSLAVFIPISGWMADRFGTRRVFASAIGIFTVGSFLCGISSNIKGNFHLTIQSGEGTLDRIFLCRARRRALKTLLSKPISDPMFHGQA